MTGANAKKITNKISEIAFASFLSEHRPANDIVVTSSTTLDNAKIMEACEIRKIPFCSILNCVARRAKCAVLLHRIFDFLSLSLSLFAMTHNNPKMGYYQPSYNFGLIAQYEGRRMGKSCENDISVWLAISFH